jgi:hypothetical protein
MPRSVLQAVWNSSLRLPSFQKSPVKDTWMLTFTMLIEIDSMALLSVLCILLWLILYR